MGDLVPITVPSRSEMWSRICLAKSVLSHRPATSETAAIALQVLDGASIQELIHPAVPARLEGDRLVVDCCPWCGNRHSHGAGNGPVPAFGHRVSHCGNGHGYYLEPVTEVG